jgi:hypothetical protein
MTSISKTSRNISPTVIDGVELVTVGQFAFLVNRTEQTVRNLFTKGNSVRKLKVKYVCGRPMIPYEEYTKFPFTGTGKYPLRDIYHYTKEGDIVPYTLEEAKC